MPVAAVSGGGKASVSNDARMLHRLGLIERVSYPGDRRDYYQLTRNSIERSIETRIQRLEAFQKVLGSAVDLPIVESRARHAATIIPPGPASPAAHRLSFFLLQPCEIGA